MLRLYGPVNPMGSCRAQLVYLTTRILGRQQMRANWKKYISPNNSLPPDVEFCSESEKEEGKVSLIKNNASLD